MEIGKKHMLGYGLKAWKSANAYAWFGLKAWKLANAYACFGLKAWKSAGVAK